jgi:hypothetical protein
MQQCCQYTGSTAEQRCVTQLKDTYRCTVSSYYNRRTVHNGIYICVCVVRT